MQRRQRRMTGRAAQRLAASSNPACGKAPRPVQAKTTGASFLRHRIAFHDARPALARQLHRRFQQARGDVSWGRRNR
jgi:hypothetical protein